MKRWFLIGIVVAIAAGAWWMLAPSLHFKIQVANADSPAWGVSIISQNDDPITIRGWVLNGKVDAAACDSNIDIPADNKQRLYPSEVYPKVLQPGEQLIVLSQSVCGPAFNQILIRTNHGNATYGVTH